MGETIRENELIQLWNDKRSQLTRAQLHSVIALAVLTFLTITGDLVAASTAEKLFAAAFLVTVGALGESDSVCNYSRGTRHCCRAFEAN